MTRLDHETDAQFTQRLSMEGLRKHLESLTQPAPSAGIDHDVPPHSWNDPAQITAEDMLREAQADVHNLGQLLDAACDELNSYPGTPSRATALVEIGRDLARRLAERMCEQ